MTDKIRDEENEHLGQQEDRFADPWGVIASEGDYVLIRARVARANHEIVFVEIEHARDGGRPTPFSLVVEKASIAAVEVR